MCKIGAFKCMKILSFIDINETVNAVAFFESVSALNFPEFVPASQFPESISSRHCLTMHLTNSYRCLVNKKTKTNRNPSNCMTYFNQSTNVHFNMLCMLYAMMIHHATFAKWAIYMKNTFLLRPPAHPHIQ